jgi:hypothetical protein
MRVNNFITHKTILLLVLCGWKLSAFAMEKELYSSESCIALLIDSFNYLNKEHKEIDPITLDDPMESDDQEMSGGRAVPRLTDLCWKAIERQKKSEAIDALETYEIDSPESVLLLVDEALKSRSVKGIIHLISKYPSLFRKIGLDIVQSVRFSNKKKDRMLSTLCIHSIDEDTKRIVKLYESYCKDPEKYNTTMKEMFIGKKIECDKKLLFLSLGSLLDLESEAPCRFLLSEKKLIVPKRITNSLLRMNEDKRTLDSAKTAQQIIQRLHFVLQNGASVDTSGRLEHDTSFNYAVQMARNFDMCLRCEASHFFYRFGDLQSPKIKLHALFFKNVVKLFVEHLINRNDFCFTMSVGSDRNLLLDQIVRYILDNEFRRSKYDCK